MDFLTQDWRHQVTNDIAHHSHDCHVVRRVACASDATGYVLIAEYIALELLWSILFPGQLDACPYTQDLMHPACCHMHNVPMTLLDHTYVGTSLVITTHGLLQLQHLLKCQLSPGAAKTVLKSMPLQPCSCISKLARVQKHPYCKHISH